MESMGVGHRERARVATQFAGSLPNLTRYFVSSTSQAAIALLEDAAPESQIYISRLSFAAGVSNDAAPGGAEGFTTVCRVRKTVGLQL